MLAIIASATSTATSAADDVTATGSHQLFNAHHFITQIGPWALFAVLGVVFIETGLPVGIVFPGDSLLFTAGAMVALQQLDHPLWHVFAIAFVAGWLGGIVGYFIGKKAGPAFFNKPDSALFNKEAIGKAHKFFEKYGAWAIIGCKFIPFLRTFGPMFAGISKLEFKKFLVYNTIGTFLWALWIPTVGYVVANNPYMKSHIDTFFAVLAVVAVIGVCYEFYKARKNNKKDKSDHKDIIQKDESETKTID